jgi:hypothetical protein
MESIHCNQCEEHGHRVENVLVYLVHAEFMCKLRTSAGGKFNDAEENTELDVVSGEDDEAGKEDEVAMEEKHTEIRPSEMYMA